MEFSECIAECFIFLMSSLFALVLHLNGFGASAITSKINNKTFEEQNLLFYKCLIVNKYMECVTSKVTLKLVKDMEKKNAKIQKRHFIRIKYNIPNIIC